MHARNTLGSSNNRQSDIMETLLSPSSPNTGAASTANQRSPGRLRSQSKQGQSVASSSSSNGWRTKRASYQLGPPEVTSEWCLSPPQKKKNIEAPSSSSVTESVSVKLVDTLAKLRGEGHAGRCSPLTLIERTWRRMEQRQDVADEKSEIFSDDTSEDDSTSTKVPGRSSSTLQRRAPGRRWRLDRMSWIASSSSLKDDVSEKEKQRWTEFRDRKTTKVHPSSNPKQSPAEPIVLSSEDDVEGEKEEAKTTHQCSRWLDKSCLGNLDKIQGPQTGKQISSSRTEGRVCWRLPTPSFLELEFTSLHAGLTHTNASGNLMITENGITIPLKVPGGVEGVVTVVASELRGYGIWDGGMAQGGALLAGWEGPAPSLLFLWVTDAQANLLQRDLSAIMNSTPSGPPCTFLLLVFKEKLQDLQTGLLTSILDMEKFKKRQLSSSVGLSSPLDWTNGLLLLHSCPPPLDEHLLGLLGHSAEESTQMRTNQRRKNNPNSFGLQQLPTRLFQYPAAPCKGRISVTKEDLACLASGQFINDVIIDFYLKYLVLEGVGGAVAQQTHIFSSFFYKQLSRRRAAGEDDAPSLPDRHMRHQRVKTWTRHVDIFTKDFLFVPINLDAHWFLVVVCFPSLEMIQYKEFPIGTGGSERPDLMLRPQRPPECTELGRPTDRVLRRPCILIMDSLKSSYRENICQILRDYLQVEWEVRRGKPRLFSHDTMKCSSCRVPQQDNNSDCGLYLLQYAESFLQNPIVHFEFPVHLENWFSRQRMRQKREEIRSLIMKLYESQQVKDQD